MSLNPQSLSTPSATSAHLQDVEDIDMDALIESLGDALAEGVEPPTSEQLCADTELGRAGDSSEVRGTVAEVFAQMKEGEQRQIKNCPWCPGRPLPKGDSVVVRRTAHSLIVSVWGSHGHRGEKQTKGGKVVSSHRWSEPLPVFSRGDHVELGRDLARHLHPSGKQRYASSTPRYGLRVYSTLERTGSDLRGGSWAEIEQPAAERRAARYAGRLIAQSQGEGKPPKIREVCLGANDVRGIVKLCRNELHEADEVYDSPWVAFTNGDLNPYGTHTIIHPDGRVEQDSTRGRFEDPCSTHRVLSERVMSFPYQPDAKSPQWEKFLVEAIPDAASRMFLQELVGASLHGRGSEWQTHAILDGVPHTGKSTFIKVIQALFPAHAQNAAPPSKWTTTFGLASMGDALVNLVSELATDELRKETALMRQVLTGDPVQVERKYKDPYVGIVKAGHIYACNGLPASGDTSGGLFRRFRVVQFPRVFAADDGFQASLLTPSCLSAVYAWALAGYKRRLAAGTYSVPGTHAASLEEWEGKSCSAVAWAQDCLVADPKAQGHSCDLFPAYRAWCAAGGFEAKNVKNFGTAMRKRFLSHLPPTEKPRTARGPFYPCRLVQQEAGGEDLTDIDLEVELHQALAKDDLPTVQRILAAAPELAARVVRARVATTEVN